MPILVKAPSAEYSYSADDIAELIARDLKAPIKDVKIQFDKKDIPNTPDYEDYIKATVAYPIRKDESIKR